MRMMIVNEIAYKERDNQVFMEDTLFSLKALHTVEKLHYLRAYKILRHVMVKGCETDVVAFAMTENERAERLIGFELKASDIRKALAQAYERRTYFDYFYIIIDLSVYFMIKEIMKQWKYIRKFGIGIISVRESKWNTFTVVVKSKYKKREDIPVETDEKTKDQTSIAQFTSNLLDYLS